jgi:hypothetical protein
MIWAWKLSDEQRGGMTTRQFIRAQLMRLGLGAELTHITRGGTRRPLASVAEVEALLAKQKRKEEPEEVRE